VVDQSLEEEDVAPDTSQDEDITHKLFGDLNHSLLGPSDSSNIIVIIDSEREKEVREDDRADVDATPFSLRDSPSPYASTDDDISDGVQDDSSDGGDGANTP
jgi:hypothetical protein